MKQQQLQQQQQQQTIDPINSYSVCYLQFKNIQQHKWHWSHANLLYYLKFNKDTKSNIDIHQCKILSDILEHSLWIKLVKIHQSSHSHISNFTHVSPDRAPVVTHRDLTLPTCQSRAGTIFKQHWLHGCPRFLKNRMPA